MDLITRLKIVEKYINDEADWNQSWVTGNRACIAHSACFVERRRELAKERYEMVETLTEAIKRLDT